MKRQDCFGTLKGVTRKIILGGTSLDRIFFRTSNKSLNVSKLELESNTVAAQKFGDLGIDDFYAPPF